MVSRRPGVGVAIVFLMCLAAFGASQLDLRGLARLDNHHMPATEPSDGANSNAASPSSQPAVATQIDARVKEPVEGVPRNLGEDAPHNLDVPTFDVARTSEDGVCVFAGRAKPKQRVNILADNAYVGSASTDAAGYWSLAIECAIPNPSADLRLTTGAHAGVSSPPPSVASLVDERASRPNGVAEINSKLFSSFEELVRKARDDARARPITTERPELMAADTARVAAMSKITSNKTAAAEPEPVRKIPIPIQFEYRTARMTDQGRRAAGLLFEYLDLTQPPRITLSGHADERGSEQLNLDLSRTRLEAVEGYLRDQGYSGKLVLLPKGESEPYGQAPRDSLSLEERYQLDRRVELRLDR